VIDLEHALVELGEHLDAPAGDDLVVAVRDGIGPRPPWRMPRAVRPMIAIVVIAAVVVLAVPPSRHAVARWLGIGAVEVRHGVPRPTGSAPVPGSTPHVSPDVAAALTNARRAVSFPIALATASRAGPLRGVQVDARVPRGLVVLSYRDFTVTEIASASGSSAPIEGKVVPAGAQLLDVSVGGSPGLWITGPHHELAYLDANGDFRLDTVRRAGPTLLWVHAGVTYRVEGLTRLADAMAVATSLTTSGT
jgi:hypothetical protein